MQRTGRRSPQAPRRRPAASERGAMDGDERTDERSRRAGCPPVRNHRLVRGPPEAEGRTPEARRPREREAMDGAERTMTTAPSEPNETATPPGRRRRGAW